MNVLATGQTRRAARNLPGATILKIIPTLTDDPTAREAVDVAVTLLRAGARVVVAAGDGPLVSEVQGLGGVWHRLVSDTTNPFTLQYNARTIAELAATERVDLIHAYGVGATRSAAARKRGAGVWLVHSYDVGDLAREARAKAYSRALAQGDRVIVPSGYVADLMTARHQVPQDKVVVIPHRVDTTRFDPAAVIRERATVLRRGWKIGRGERVLLVPGTIAPEHDQLMLVEVARILVNGGMRDVVLVLAGDNRRHPDYARSIADQAEAHGVAPLIRQIGYCPDMPGAYTAADFVVLPASEPPTFGRLASEAMAMARPVIAAAIGALPEIVLAPPHVPESARTGWLFAPDDAIGLARAIAEALAIDARSYREIGARSYQLAGELFAPARVSAATLGVYSTLLEGG